ncbi:MAG: hypothetical protein AAFX52_10160 [Pseudomonadota bacterium]
MAGEKARMVFTDPPYNVPVEGHASDLGKVKNQEFVMADNGAEKKAKPAPMRSVVKQRLLNTYSSLASREPPKGRPKGAQNKPKMQASPAMQLQNLILEEAYRDVETKDGDRVIRLPIAQFALRSLGAKSREGRSSFPTPLCRTGSRYRAAGKERED